MYRTKPTVSSALTHTLVRDLHAAIHEAQRSDWPLEPGVCGMTLPEQQLQGSPFNLDRLFRKGLRSGTPDGLCQRIILHPYHKNVMNSGC